MRKPSPRFTYGQRVRVKQSGKVGRVVSMPLDVCGSPQYIIDLGLILPHYDGPYYGGELEDATPAEDHHEDPATRC